MTAIALLLYAICLATTMSGMEIFGTLICLTLLPAIFRGEARRWESLPFWRPLLAFSIVYALGVIFGAASPSDRFHDLGRLRFYVMYAGFFYALRSVSAPRDPLATPWFRGLTFACAAIGVYGFLQHFMPLDLIRPEGKKVYLYAIQDEKIGPLVVGMFNHHLTFASIYLSFACLFTAMGIYFLPRRKWMVALGALLFVLCIWSGSRAAWVAVPVCALVIAAFCHRRAALVVLAAIAIAAPLLYALDPGVRERFDRTVFREDALYNLGPRQRLWNAQLEFLKESPLIGVGANNNERRAKEVVDRLYPEVKDNFYGHAHSNLLQILATTGILGLAAFLWLWFEIFRATWRAARLPRDRWERWLGVALFTAFVGFHIQGATQWNFGDAEVLHNVIFLWALAALVSKTTSPRPAH